MYKYYILFVRTAWRIFLTPSETSLEASSKSLLSISLGGFIDNSLYCQLYTLSKVRDNLNKNIYIF